MKLKFQFDIFNVCDGFIAVPVWEDKPVFNGIISLNETALYIFEKLKEDISEMELINSVAEHFSCSKEDAQKNVLHIVNGLKKSELLID